MARLAMLETVGAGRKIVASAGSQIGVPYFSIDGTYTETEDRNGHVRFQMMRTHL